MLQSQMGKLLKLYSQFRDAADRHGLHLRFIFLNRHDRESFHFTNKRNSPGHVLCTELHLEIDQHFAQESQK